MKDIEISYHVGNEIKQLRIAFLSNGTGQIMLDKYYHGQVVFSQNQWRVYLNDKSELKNSGDIQTLIEILTGQHEI
jgi:hypothetical protein